VTIEYSSRREVRAERACWRVGKLQDTELNILATMREITMRTIKATVQEIEKFIREYGLHSTITKVERVRGLTSFRLTDTVEDDTGKKTGVEWANILVIEKDEGTEVIKQFNADYIYKSFKDGERRAQFIDGYRDTLNTLHADIIEHFEQEKPKRKKTKHKQVLKSGRPHEDEDVWLWEQVNIHNRGPEEVKPEWIARAKANPDRSPLPASLKRQFNLVIKPEWKKKE